VCLNILVMYVVSLPIQVNVDHFCFFISICEFLVWFCLGFEIFHGLIGKKLLYRMLWIMFFPDYILRVIGICV
jgi:hypothetical protein